MEAAESIAMNVLLIDLSSIAHPLFHVSAPPFSDVSVKTVERVRALASGQPHVGVCVEGGRSFRKDLDPTYKANRPPTDAALYHQIDLAIDILRADGFPILRAQGFEADDVIATAVGLGARWYTEDGETRETANTLIASADKDLLQLINERVSVKSLKDGSIIDAAAVEAKFGVRPDQMFDFLALCGDTTDNIKGCKDVGKVRAAGLLKKYGSIDKLFKVADGSPEEFTPALTAALHDFRTRLNGVRDLIRLRTDAPISIDAVLKERVPLDVAEFGEESAIESAAAAAGEGLLDEVEAIYQRKGVMTTAGDTDLPAVDASDSATTGAIVNTGPVAPVVNGHALAVIEPTPIEWERQLEPRNMQQMKLLATDLFASRLFSSYGHAAGVMSTILAGRELGLPAMASLRGFHIIENKPTMAADLIRALVIRSGVCEYFRCTERTNERATFVAKRKGDPEISLTFTIEDGKCAWSKGQAAWDASGWGRNSADMCVARAGSKLARLVAPDVVSGLYSPEEVE